jgi:hypothetical protein
MTIVGWLFAIGALLLAVRGLLRAMFPKPDADVQATFERIDRRRDEASLAADRAAERAADDVEREYP